MRCVSANTPWSVRHPVLRLDFGNGDYRTPGYLHQNLMAQLDALERRSGVGSDSGRPIWLVGVEFSRETRNLAAFEVERA